MSDSTWAELVLDGLDDVKEDLLNLYEEIQQDGDVRDPAARRETLAVLAEFNEKFEPLERALDEMMAFIERVMRVKRGGERKALTLPQPIRVTYSTVPLDSTQPHSVGESFRHKVPYGFALRGQTYQVESWKQLYELFLEQLAAHDAERFQTVPDTFPLNTDVEYQKFTRSAADHPRTPLKLPYGIYCKGSMAAEAMFSNIRRLLAHFDIPESEMVVYLRGERQEQ